MSRSWTAFPALAGPGSRSHARRTFAILLIRLHLPDDSQGMQYQMIRQCQFGGVHNDLIGILNGRVPREAPGFVGEQVAAMLTTGLRAIRVVLLPRGGARVRHNSPPIRSHRALAEDELISRSPRRTKYEMSRKGNFAPGIYLIFDSNFVVFPHLRI